MKVEAVLIYEKGRSIARADRSRMPKYRGELRIREARSQALGRTVTMADLISSTDGSDESVIPSLHDVNVIYLSSGTMRIRGFEDINGTQYGQTWDMKVS
jgi:hypothetical protein